ncbi:hypothetical protein LEP1GSC050_0044 [Leptospira phage vB_LbrZ_5399-LE1]|uniref:Histidine kinase N-terminal 7TM region domain-containing protein n=1 Tax=Leptospira inadai serovar Lyme TaxID=293084 RepID=A0ABX4YGE0_9LEPT|nr:histidine kinase N-terminal 7TM domain-containing protein [Leptospira inadai]AGS80709.1 hypothetical protein LEP1GSC050_0044 [Leptospira phage vB_LbrZ_5399-LE1]AGS80883.1 hypothetical protein LEP1GSC047_0827 [Leptospira phage vB_LinZ_10-LE1]PNV74308.1 hypothetical protein BES34_014070 [Leptospira inadai serovar Lyme]
MNLPSIICFVVAVYILVIGFYVFFFKEIVTQTQKYFLLFCLSISAWLFWFAIRPYFPKGLMAAAANWTTFPAILIPFSFYCCAKSYVNSDFRPSKKIVLLNIAIVAFLLYRAATSQMVEYIGHNETGGVVYTPTYSYHIFILYSVVLVLFSLKFIANRALKGSGQERVNATIFVAGCTFGLLSAITFIYILPLFGIFIQYLTSVGMFVTISVWAIVILQYDAFELKTYSVTTEEIPIPIRPVNKIYRIIFRFLEPKVYNEKRNKAGAELVLSILNYYVTMARVFPDREPIQIAKLVADKYSENLR